MIVGPAAGAGPRRRDPRRAAGGHRARRRAAHAGGLPDPQPQRDRRPVRGRTSTTTRSTSCALPLARVPGVGRVEVSAERHARDRGRRRSAAARWPAGLTVDDVADGAEGVEPACAPVGRYPRRAACSTWSLASGLWTLGGRHRRRRRSSVEERIDRPRVRPRRRRARARRTARRSSPATASDAAIDQRVAAGRRPTSSTCATASRRRSRELTNSLPSGLHVSKVYDLAGVRGRRDRQRARRDPHRRRARRRRAASSSCATGASRSWRRLTLPLTVDLHVPLHAALRARRST